MREKFIQENIISNKDNYNPRQLTCFQKPWAILFSSINENYFDLYLFVSIFYENFMYNDYFYWEDFNENLNENFYKFAKEILEPRFGVKINKVKYKNKENFISKIENSLSEGHKVLVPTDLIELPYYECYKMENHVHFFIIKGYDREKRIFYVLDNMHIDNGSNGKYKNFVFTYNQMYLIAQKCFESFFTKEYCYFFWELSDVDMSYKYTIWDALINHKRELEMINKQVSTINFPEIKIINEGTKNINNFSRSYAKILNYKQVYYDILFKLLKEIDVPEEDIKNLDNIKKILYKEWESLRLYILYYASKKNKIFSELQKEYDKCILNEKSFRKCLISIIDNNEERGRNYLKSKKREKYILYEHNLNKATIKREKNNISVYHSSNSIYDTWRVQDNAAQLKFLIDTKDVIEFKFDLFLDNTVDFPFFGGLIIKNKKGESFLFGDDAKCSLALYCPQWESKFIIKKELFYSDAISLKIKIENENISFFYKEVGQVDWNLFISMEIRSIKEIGIISKTWNSIDHISVFKNIEVFINNKESKIYYL